MAKAKRQSTPEEAFLVGFTIADIEVFLDRQTAIERMKKRLFDLQNRGIEGKSVTFRPVKVQ